MHSMSQRRGRAWRLSSSYKRASAAPLDDGRKEPAGAVLPQKCPLDAHLPRTVHLYACLALFVLALTVRVLHIAYPASVVFDEVHFLRFVKNYWDGRYLFDIHPPLGKLILLAVSKTFCMHPDHELKNIGEKLGSTQCLPMRYTSALFGAAVSPVMYLLGIELGLSIPASMLPALAQALDHLVVTESRIVVMDAQLLFFMALSLLCALRLFGSRVSSSRRTIYLISTALAASAAASVKWTTLVTPLLIAIVSLRGAPFMRRRLLVKEMLLAGAIALSLYVILFKIHFDLLPLSGDGDAFMKTPFQQGLIGNKNYDPDAPRPGFWANFIWLNGEMFRANKRITARHHWESKWYQWVITQRGLLYFDEPAAHLISRIYLIVNPVVAFAVLAAVVLSFAAVVAVRVQFSRGRLASYDRLHAFSARALFLLTGYVLNLLPYLEVSRCTFLYHYIPPLFYAQLVLANLVDIAPRRVQWRVLAVFTVLLAASFAFWAPWIYGTPLSANAHRTRRLFGKHWE